jgi:carboxylesterase
MSKLPVFRNPQLDGTPFYWEAGPVGVLLCHGFTATTTEVRLLAHSLHAQGYTVAAPLLPGHGTSPEDCNRHTWQDWLSAADQTYVQLASRCRAIVVGGESAGALLALQLAYKYQFTGAILCYSPALRLKLSPGNAFLLSLLVPFIAFVPKSPARDDNPWKGYTVNPLKGARELLRLQEATYPLLPHLHQPILVMQGKLDPTVHPSAPQVVYDRVSSPVKELHWLENSTHCVILDKERHLAAQLTLNFLSRVLTA